MSPYFAQLAALAEMNAGLGTPIYQGVLRAMNKVTRASQDQHLP